MFYWSCSTPTPAPHQLKPTETLAYRSVASASSCQELVTPFFEDFIGTFAPWKHLKKPISTVRKTGLKEIRKEIDSNGISVAVKSSRPKDFPSEYEHYKYGDINVVFIDDLSGNTFIKGVGGIVDGKGSITSVTPNGCVMFNSGARIGRCN